ncbi:hypothetical protein [Romboutsia maritimum]|nr:hypothetical protein [Romboutsia maritimum]
MELYRNQELIDRAQELYNEGYSIFEALDLAEKELEGENNNDN